MTISNRSKGSLKDIKISRHSTKLAELVGIILGDGHLHKKANCITIVGSLEDKSYYLNHVMKLFHTLFGIEPKLRKRNDRNAYYLQLENKSIFEVFTLRLGLKRGNKKDARVPKYIYRNKKLLFSFLRGVFDTDGCLKFSKQRSDKNYYPRIQLNFLESPFAYDVEKAIAQAGFNYSTWYNARWNGARYFHISGRNNLKNWFEQVNPANPVHQSKYAFWKQFGHVIPKSTLKEREQALDLNSD
tara:strand:- start:1809 stop:2537 length:729 start_codon:yes stop_codon:yes gene_type:complete